MTDMPHRTHERVEVLVFAASLRADSLNARLAALAARAISGRGATVNLATMAEFDCPSYNLDVQQAEGFPRGAEAFRRRLETNDAFVIASPEYNSSMPGFLKNAIDWVSRYQPQPFNGKHAMLLSASPSMVGGNRALRALRIPLEYLGTRVYPHMFSLAQAHEAFGPSGEIADSRLAQRLDRAVVEFLDLVEAAKHYPRIKQAWVEFLGEHPNVATDRVEGPAPRERSGAPS